MERVLKVGIWIAAALLAAGLAGWLTGHEPATRLIHGGLWVLIGVPITRMLTALVGYVREEDWTFVALSAVVLICLFFPIVRALLSLQR
jgi:uncharacterized membrane protein